MGYQKQPAETIRMSLSNVSIGDSYTAMVGQNGVLSATQELSQTPIMKTGHIRSVTLIWKHNTQNCTAEDIAFNIRVNNTTDYAVYTGSFQDAASPQKVTGLNIPVHAGDFIHLKLVSPAWATNPTGTYFNVGIELQY